MTHLLLFVLGAWIGLLCSSDRVYRPYVAFLAVLIVLAASVVAMVAIILGAALLILEV